MTIKLALSTKHFDQLDSLLKREIETMEFELVDRAICEPADSGWMQLIPYSSISYFDPNNGDLSFVSYERAKGSGEERLVSATSIGFGGHIDSVSEITCTRMETREDGSVVYHMSATDLMTTAIAACKREWTEEIGFDPIEEFGVDIHNSVRFTFFRDSSGEDEVGQVHFGLSIPLTVSEEQLKTVYEKAALQDSEIKDLKQLVISAGQVLLSFDVSEVASGLIKRMAAEQKLEPWSVQVVSQRLLEYFELMRNHISYHDLITAVKNNVEIRRVELEAQEKAAQEAAEAEAQRVQDEANGIQDAEVKEVVQEMPLAAESAQIQ